MPGAVPGPATAPRERPRSFVANEAPAPLTDAPPPVEAPAEGAPAPDPVVADPAVDPAVTPTPAPEPEKAPEPGPAAKAFAALARKEKALIARESGIKAQETSLQRLARIEELAKTNPAAALRELQIDYSALTDSVLAEGKEPTADDRVAQLEKWKQEREECEAKAAADAQARDVDTKIAAWCEGITKEVTSAGDKFECINAQGKHSDVTDLIENYFEVHKAILPWDQAAEYVEAHLEAEARKVLGLKKFAPKSAPVSEQKPGAQATSSPTLTSRSVSEAPVLTDGKALPLDPIERNRALVQEFRLYD